MIYIITAEHYDGYDPSYGCIYNSGIVGIFHNKDKAEQVLLEVSKNSNSSFKIYSIYSDDDVKLPTPIVNEKLEYEHLKAECDKKKEECQRLKQALRTVSDYLYQKQDYLVINTYIEKILSLYK